MIEQCRNLIAILMSGLACADATFQIFAHTAQSGALPLQAWARDTDPCEALSHPLRSAAAAQDSLRLAAESSHHRETGADFRSGLRSHVEQAERHGVPEANESGVCETPFAAQDDALFMDWSSQPGTRPV